MSEVPIVRDPPPEADRLRPGVLAIVALVSMGVGFLVVYLPGRGGGDAPPAQREERTPQKQGRAEQGETREPSTPLLAVAPRPAGTATPAPAAETAAPDTADPTPAPAPATADDSAEATPAATAAPGGALRARAGDLYYWRCWDDGRDDPLPAEHCERLRAIEPMVADQLDEVATCARERGGGPGKLSLGLELNFTTKAIRYWGGRSSTIANAADVAGCIRNRWRIDLEAIRHQHSRYTIFVPVDLEAR